MTIADLHTHTNFSDGELSPSEVLNEALIKKIKYLSITDHDTLSGYKKAKKILSDPVYNQITLIPGVEISTSFEGSNIHTLGYFFDVGNKELNETLKLLQIRRNEFAKNFLGFLKLMSILIQTVVYKIFIGMGETLDIFRLTVLEQLLLRN